MENIKSITIAILIGLCIWAFGRDVNYYAVLGEVIELNYNDDEVIFQATNGRKYTYNGVNNWKLGDYASLCMDDNGTCFTQDDKIILTTHESLLPATTTHTITFATK